MGGILPHHEAGSRPLCIVLGRHARRGLRMGPGGIVLFPSAFEATYVPYY